MRDCCSVCKAELILTPVLACPQGCVSPDMEEKYFACHEAHVNCENDLAACREVANKEREERIRVVTALREALAMNTKEIQTLREGHAVLQREIERFSRHLGLPGDGRLLSDQVIEAFDMITDSGDPATTEAEYRKALARNVQYRLRIKRLEDVAEAARRVVPFLRDAAHWSHNPEYPDMAVAAKAHEQFILRTLKDLDVCPKIDIEQIARLISPAWRDRLKAENDHMKAIVVAAYAWRDRTDKVTERGLLDALEADHGQ